MSATIGINNSKFVIFGAGHDYTLADSGEGEKVFFSHPFVPLNSVNYAGQYYFLAPVFDPNDETAEPVITDVVKDDIAHCTFTPALNTAFDTEGEVEITVKYRREYIYPEATILVEKELTQTIEVVDHGTVSTSNTYYDVYSDGYGFIRPKNVNTVEAMKYEQFGGFSKVSSIPWRATGLGNSQNYHAFILNNSALTDISELEYADTSNCTDFYNVFYMCSNLEDISALSGWDTSKVTMMYGLFQGSSKIADLKPLKTWNTSKVTNLTYAFKGLKMETLEGLENWDVSNVTTLAYAFYTCTKLKDISALADWDISKVDNMYFTFNGCTALTSLKGMETWDFASVTNMESTFEGDTALSDISALANCTPKPTTLKCCFKGCKAISNLSGLAKFDTSDCTSLEETFNGLTLLRSLTGLEHWITSKVTNFKGTFQGMPFLETIIALKDWDLSEATTCYFMFRGNAYIHNLNDINWTFKAGVNMNNMFGGFQMYHSATLNKDVWKNAYNYIDYEGNSYPPTGVQDAVAYPLKNALNASNWSVQETSKGAFDSYWDNIPSWN